jgi:DNA-binding NarL/FixJ family response regulator
LGHQIIGCGNVNNSTNFAEGAPGESDAPVIAIIARHLLTRSCILGILGKELTGFSLVGLATASDAHRARGKEVRLIVLDIGDRSISDARVEGDLAALARWFPSVPVALLSGRDDEATVLAAMRLGVCGFFPMSIPLGVAIAGFRLVLTGGIYRPQPMNEGLGEVSRLKIPRTSINGHDPSSLGDMPDAERNEAQYTTIDLTPRERHVLEALEHGLPNKLIASRLKLSENTVKMHIRHIMRKCFARNRTEAVLVCSGRLPRVNGHLEKVSAGYRKHMGSGLN